MNETNYINRVEKDPTEQKKLLLLLRAYAVATAQNSFKLPKLVYIDEIAGNLDWTRSKAQRYADDFVKKFFRVPTFNLNQSMSLYLGMFNAQIDTNDLINLTRIKNKVEENGFIEKKIDDITIKPVSFQTGHGKFKKLTQYTEEYGSKNFNKTKKPTYIQFLLKIKKGTKIQGASFNIYHTGRIRFSGGYLDGSKNEATALVKYISQTYFPINLREHPIVFNNNTVEIKLSSNIRILGLFTVIDVARESAKFKGYTLSATYEPDKYRFNKRNKKESPFLYITFKKDNDKFGLVMSRSGTVILEGVKDVRETVDLVREFFTALKESNLLETPKGNRNLTITHKPSKLARRVNNTPAPEITRRGTTCPIPRRPNPYSFQGSCPQGVSFYVRPNPQGQPCCYKKPKSIQYIRNRLENRYNRANVKVPAAVRKTFGIGGNTNQKADNVGKTSLNNLEITFNRKIGKNKKNPVGLKIDSRQCLRYSKVALVDIAHRQGIMLPKKVTKPIICALLAKAAPLVQRRALPANLQRNIKSQKVVLRKVAKKPKTPSQKQKRRTLPANLQRNIKSQKVVLRKAVKKTKTPSPSPSPNNSDFNSLLDFAKRLKTS